MANISKRTLAFLLIAILGGTAVASAQDDGLPTEMPLTLDQEYAEMAERVPGFGGLYLDERGTTHVYLVDLAREREVQSLGERVEVHQGDYDFRDLYAWKNELRNLLSREGMVSLDIDETRNRLVLAAEPDFADGLRNELIGLLRPTSVPPAAVLVEVGELPEPMADLQDRIRPIPSGVQIRNENQGGCTLGVNTTRAGVRGFVTNSHCTGKMGVVEGTLFYQKDVWWEDRVGVEEVDPAFVPSSAFVPSWMCADGFRCRYSDSAFVAYDDAALSEGGNIALPASCLNPAGTLEIGTALPRLPITGSSYANPPIGSILRKVGRTTGCTLGPLKQTCSDIIVVAKIDGELKPTDMVLLCQNQVLAAVNPGDSGSPVFRRLGNEAILEGLLWGKSANRFLYSPWSSVTLELGIPHLPDAP
jgi:hypothetical protein